MHERQATFRKGALLLEAVIAIGIAAMLMSAVAGFVFVASRGSERAQEIQTAVWTNAEGIEALRSIDFANLSPTETGALNFSSPTWTVNTNGPETREDGSTRLITIATISRDASCNIVTSGGTVDPDSLKLTSTTTWIDTDGREHSVTSSAIRTNWKNPSGSCFGPAEEGGGEGGEEGGGGEGQGNPAGQQGGSGSSGQAKRAFIITAIANASTDGTLLDDIFIWNWGFSTITIDSVRFTWTNGATVDQMYFNSTKTWSSGGPGTPAGSQTSSTTLDNQNYNLSFLQIAEINKLRFNQSMIGVPMTMKVTFSDGSTYTSPTFTPN